MEVTVTIALEDLLKLDGNCSERTQRLITDYRVATGDLMIESPYEFVKAAVIHALRTGEFRCRSARTECCAVCGKRAGYTTYKQGLLKGEPNYRSPIKYWGVNYAFTGNKKILGQVCIDCELEHDFESQIQNFITENKLNIKLYETSKHRWGNFQKAK